MPGGDGPKDTLANARATGALCVNVVTEAQLEAMNRTSAEVGPDVDEFDLAGLEGLPSPRVDAPYVAGCPAVLECELRKEVELPESLNVLLVLEVVGVILDSSLVPEDGYGVAPELLRPVGRMGGSGYMLPGSVPGDPTTVTRTHWVAASEPSTLGPDLFRWLYLGRITLLSGILAGALLAWFEADPADTLVATVIFLVAVLITGASFWYTHLLKREPGEAFRYGQVVLDVILVTAVIHITGGPDSSFAPLYILVIAAGALLLPLPGGVLVGILASIVYFADLALGHQSAFTLEVALRISLFALVALATGLLGDRLRRAGQALGDVASQLEQLRPGYRGHPGAPVHGGGHAGWLGSAPVCQPGRRGSPGCGPGPPRGRGGTPHDGDARPGNERHPPPCPG